MHSRSSKLQILLVYGKGGHEVQVNRLAKGLNAVSPLSFVALTDSFTRHDWCDDYYLVNEVRDKHVRHFFAPMKNALGIFVELLKVKKQHNIKLVISTGPGVCVFAAIFFKLLGGARIIHLETWSRFYSRSLTGRIMYRLADVFYIQNRELASQYPNAVFSGRL